jgi:hypothetical protein
MSDHSLLTDVERFIKTANMAESAFGRGAVNDWKFVRGLRGGRRVWPETEAKVRAFMANHAAPVEQKRAA